MLGVFSRSSIKHGLLQTVILVTALALSLSFALTTYVQIQNYKQSLEARSIANVDVLVRVLREAIEKNDLSHADYVLRGLQGSGFITHLHLYRYEQVTDQMLFFTSFNRPDLPPLPARTNRLEALEITQFNDDSIELARPVLNEDHQRIGYVYLRTSLQELNHYKWRAILTAFVTTVLSVFLAAMVANWMRQRLVSPLHRLNRNLRDIHTQQAFHLRLPPAELSEIDQFSLGVNSLLDKLQRVQKQHEEAELHHQEFTQELEDKIAQRTKALREANNELISTLEQLHASQHRRIETERLASMTDMVAGIAHEINTPIGLSVTSASIIAERIDLLLQHKHTFPDPSFGKVFEDLNTNIGVVQRNLTKASELIGSFRSLAFEHANESPVAVNVMELSTHVNSQVQPLLDSNPAYKLVIEAPDTIVYVRPRPVETILTELIENAVHHAFKGREQGHIQLELSVDDSTLMLTCRDDGVGMNEEMQHRIFEPFMTSSRVSGHPGLGMHLVYNLVTQVLKGTIECQSKLGEGSEIRVTIPLFSKTNF